MNPLSSTISRAALRRAPFFLRTQPRLLPNTFPTSRAAPALVSLRLPQHARGAASNVSGRPGSQTAEHAATNIKEELGHSVSDLAKGIAGGNMTADAVAPTHDTFLGVTSAVAQSVPKPYIMFGLAGGLPYLAASSATVYLARQAGLAASGLTSTADLGPALAALEQALAFQTTYGAVMLSFLGALHWGMEFAGYGGGKGYARLTLGAVPVVYGWATLALDPLSALIAQWVGFTGLWYADLKATGAGWTPKWYSQYRFYLSILVGTCIIGSLAGTSYFGPVAGHGKNTHELNEIRAKRKQAKLETEGTVPGDVEAVPAGEDADVYVQVKKKAPPKDESDEKEGKDSEKEDGEGQEKGESKEKGQEKGESQEKDQEKGESKEKGQEKGKGKDDKKGGK